MKKHTLIIFIMIFIITTSTFAKTIHISQLNKDFKITNQNSTGTYSYDNCSVTALYMIFQLIDIDKGRPSEIRTELKNQSGWVYSNDIDTYLRDNEIEYEDSYIDDKNDLIRLIKDDRVLLLCLDLSKISYRSSDIKVNNKYVGKSNVGTGHFIVVTGCYVDTDNGVEYLEVLDSLNYEVRYYSLDEVYESVRSWYPWIWSFKIIDESV